MRQEIEVKARVSDMQAIEEKLRALGCTISEPVIQDDTVFVDYSEAYDQMSPGKNFLRIRKSNDKTLFTVKQPQQGELDCFEHETEISDAEEMRQAILLMGYHEAIKIYKTRRKTNQLFPCNKQLQPLDRNKWALFSKIETAPETDPIFEISFPVAEFPRFYAQSKKKF
jgi:predicted adenylyl cyclase CyaB